MLRLSLIDVVECMANDSGCRYDVFDSGFGGDDFVVGFRDWDESKFRFSVLETSILLHLVPFSEPCVSGEVGEGSV